MQGRCARLQNLCSMSCLVIPTRTQSSIFHRTPIFSSQPHVSMHTLISIHVCNYAAVLRVLSASHRARISIAPSALVRTRGGRSCRRAASMCGGRRPSLRMTEPIARKKEKVAALLSMYCERVARNPRGPEPFRRMLYDPKMKPMVRPTPPPIIAPIFNFCHTEGSCALCAAGRGGIVSRVVVRSEREVWSMLLVGKW